MIEKYKSVAGETVTEKIIEKSRFITVSRHMCGDDGAKSFIAEVSKKHADATHNCYAYVADNLGNLLRFSDDGEPQGTAGLPILEVIKNKKLFETAVAVVRYFGGVKLGAGGLVRAYSSSASENLAGAEIRTLELCVEYEIAVEYAGIDGLQKYLSSYPCTLLSSEYGEKVLFRVAVRKRLADAFVSGVKDFMQGRAEAAPKGEYFGAFKE